MQQIAPPPVRLHRAVRRLSLTLFACGAAATFTACTPGSSDSTSPNTPKVSRVVVSPDTTDLAIGGTATLTAVPEDSTGTAVTLDSTVTWKSSDSTIASVSTGGVVTAVSPGTAIMTASIESVTGNAVVVVAPPPVTLQSVSISPSAATISVNDTVRFTATPIGSNGNPMTGQPAATWTTSDSSVATVSSSGLVTGKSAGSATITGTISGKSATANVTVNAPVVTLQRIDVTPDTATVSAGDTVRFTATAYGSDGRVMTTVPPATWTTGSDSIATISSNGVLTAKAAGATSVTATISGVSGSATVVVKSTSTTTTTLNVGSQLSLKRLGTGGIDTLQTITVAGDHEQTGDKELEGFVTYDLSGIASGSTVQKAMLTVSSDSAQSYNSPWTLGTLYVEGTGGYVLDEGTLSTTAIPVASANFGATQVDITSIVKQAIAAHQTSVILLFRYPQLGNNNGKIDYVWINPGSISLTLSK